MIITVAGEKKEVKDNLTLSELIILENVETPEYVTVSINEEFVEDKENTDFAFSSGCCDMSASRCVC